MPNPVRTLTTLALLATGSMAFAELPVWVVNASKQNLALVFTTGGSISATVMKDNKPTVLALNAYTPVPLPYPCTVQLERADPADFKGGRFKVVDASGKDVLDGGQLIYGLGSARDGKFSQVELAMPGKNAKIGFNDSFLGPNQNPTHLLLLPK